MKFNEKLIELRKREGLSQEELGHRLNVTRQTVSKWELGQTTPEMDKLVEMARLFNVSTDELAGASEIEYKSNAIIEDKTIGNNEDKRKVVIIIVAVVLGLVLLGALTLAPIFKFVNNTFGIIEDQIGMKQEGVQDIMQGAQNIIQGVQNEMQDNQIQTEETKNQFQETFEDAQQFIEEGKNKVEEVAKDLEIDEFNSTFEFYQGTKPGTLLSHLLDEIITSNKKEDRKVTLKFEGKELTNGDKIKYVKTEIENFDKYEISFEYDEEGYIFEVLVEQVK